jgi:hypothetical protein
MKNFNKSLHQAIKGIYELKDSFLKLLRAKRGKKLNQVNIPYRTYEIILSGQILT